MCSYYDIALDFLPPFIVVIVPFKTICVSLEVVQHFGQLQLLLNLLYKKLDLI